MYFDFDFLILKIRHTFVIISEERIIVNANSKTSFHNIKQTILLKECAQDHSQKSKHSSMTIDIINTTINQMNKSYIKTWRQKL